MVQPFQNQTIKNLNKMAAIFSDFSMVLDKMAVILFKTEHYWKTENHWKTEQKATIGIPKAFDIPAPTVIVWMVYMGFYRSYKCCLSHFLYLLNWR